MNIRYNDIIILQLDDETDDEDIGTDKVCKLPCDPRVCQTWRTRGEVTFSFNPSQRQIVILFKYLCIIYENMIMDISFKMP